WGGNGFWLLMKRLEEDRFVWPRRQQPVMELTTEQLHCKRPTTTPFF
ncbi:IS66 family insertion sequence element accessory protein TnpB, partial [Pararobbsia alpina]